MSTRSFSFSNDKPLSTQAVPVNASSSRYEEDWPSIPHTHAFTELFYVSRGGGEFLIQNSALFHCQGRSGHYQSTYPAHGNFSERCAPFLLYCRSGWNQFFFPGSEGISDFQLPED